jgi:hypothetical protein
MPALSLPADIGVALEPLFETIPFEQAMPELVTGFRPSSYAATVDELLASPALRGQPDLTAGVLVYADDLDRAHRLVQDDASSTGSMWHAIIHRREGDFSNSGYWLRRAGAHPAFSRLDGYDAGGFLADVERRHAGNPIDLLEMQRKEWLALFTWCASQGAGRG